MKLELFGFRLRREACRMAAQAVQGPWCKDRDDISQVLWSLAVFFEEYMRHGSEGTREDFGPKDAVSLGVVRMPIGKEEA